jgi:hypothetical protein
MRPHPGVVKFYLHVDDHAVQDMRGFWPITTDMDLILRPWRFAHSNPMPTLVLFPRVEHAIKRMQRARGEFVYRIRMAVLALKGDLPDDEWS